MAVVLEQPAGALPLAGERLYVPRGAARELMRCRSPEVLLAGPAGTGKSRACLEKLHLAALNHPRMRGAIVRKVRRSLTQSALVTFETKVLPESPAVRFNHEDQEYRYLNGSRIAVAGMDDAEKLKSSEYDLVYVQEATELAMIDWEMLLSRLRNGVMSYQQLIADCNPGDPGHWLKRRCDAGVTLLLDSRHADNPSLTPGYLATLDRLTGYLYERLRLGLWTAAEGMYFPEFRPELHVCDRLELPAEWPRWLAVDYGFAAPFCCLWLARSPDRRIYVYRELYAAGLRDEQQAALISRRSEGERILRRVADPSMFAERREQGKPSIASVYGQNGVMLERASNQRVAGWNACRRALAVGDEPGAKPRLQIVGVACPNLVRTIPAMVHDGLDPEDLADEVKGVKTEDHAVDAWRYGMMGEGQAPVPTRQYGTSTGNEVEPESKAERVLVETRRRLDAWSERG